MLTKLFLTLFLTVAFNLPIIDDQPPPQPRPAQCYHVYLPLALGPFKQFGLPYTRSESLPAACQPTPTPTSLPSSTPTQTPTPTSEGIPTGVVARTSGCLGISQSGEGILTVGIDVYKLGVGKVDHLEINVPGGSVVLNYDYNYDDPDIGLFVTFVVTDQDPSVTLGACVEPTALPSSTPTFCQVNPIQCLATSTSTPTPTPTLTLTPTGTTQVSDADSITVFGRCLRVTTTGDGVQYIYFSASWGDSGYWEGTTSTYSGSGIYIFQDVPDDVLVFYHALIFGGTIELSECDKPTETPTPTATDTETPTPTPTDTSTPEPTATSTDSTVVDYITGCVRLTNPTSTKQFVTYSMFTGEEPDYTTDISINPGEYFEFNLPPGSHVGAVYWSVLIRESCNPS